MSETATLPAIQTSTPNLSFNYDNAVEFLKSLDDLLDDFGPEELGNAAARQYLGVFINGLRDEINASDMPQGLKDMANATLDEHESGIAADMPSSDEASDAVARSLQSDDINRSAEADVRTLVGGANSGDSSTNRDAGDLDGWVASDAGNTGVGNDTGKENWLEVLARALAEIQATFLDKALEASEVMSEEANNVTGSGGDTEPNDRPDVSESTGGKSRAFLDAQADYAANMQLFTIFSNQTSTSIKSIGEAMAGISRKQ